jgi:hypothetical protein
MAQLSYSRHRFPAEIIQHVIWLYLRFTLSYRDVEELLAERGLDWHAASPATSSCGEHSGGYRMHAHLDRGSVRAADGGLPKLR